MIQIFRIIIILIIASIFFQDKLSAQTYSDTLNSTNRKKYELLFRDEWIKDLKQRGYFVRKINKINLSEFRSLVEGKIYDRVACCAEMIPGIEEGVKNCSGCNLNEAINLKNWLPWGKKTNQFFFHGDSLVSFVFILDDGSLRDTRFYWDPHSIWIHLA